MNIWQWAGKLFLVGLMVVLMGSVCQAKDYYRLVILADTHLPFRAGIVTSPEKQAKIVAAKKAALQDIRQWDDVDGVVVVGDVTAERGRKEEYSAAAAFFSPLNKPIFFVTGNHDYRYGDRVKERGTPASRMEKLERFRMVLGQQDLYYFQEINGYLLVFLSADSLTSRYLTEISEEQLAWLRKVLAAYSEKPTIIFFHSPLEGTLETRNANDNSPNFVAQPAQKLAELIRENPQIFLWVSGHTHTPATRSDFAGPVNLFAGQVTDIHNADWDREVIWSNSLYLYPDRVEVRTYQHNKETWLPSLARRIFLPSLSCPTDCKGDMQTK